jgi:hypothetical protein
VRIIWSEIAQATFVRFMADQAGMMAAAHRFEQLTDDRDPASVAAEDQSDLRASPRQRTVCAAVRLARRDHAEVSWSTGRMALSRAFDNMANNRSEREQRMSHGDKIREQAGPCPAPGGRVPAGFTARIKAAAR